MKRLGGLVFITMMCLLSSEAADKRWTVADGLPTGEVQQMVALPNGQVLVNCEGVFCLSNGKGFSVLPCNRLQCLSLEHYSEDYAHLWQGDSLLWLHDFYQLYLFDARTRSFRYDFKGRTADDAVRRFLKNDSPGERLTPQWRIRLDTLGVGTQFTTAIEDWQGGIWLGTTHEGIHYLAPHRTIAQRVDNRHLIDFARSTIDSHGRIWRCKADGLECEAHGQTTRYDINNVEGLPHNRTTFIQELGDGRYLLCDSLCLLGYFLPDKSQFVLLNDRLSPLRQYRRLVGACPIDDRQVLVYSQNGAFLLDTKTTTLKAFDAVKTIERYSNKYNCAIRDPRGRLWIGTQNGLFVVDKESASRMNGLANNCIRSLVVDTDGHVWAGTSCGISRVSPKAINFNSDDGLTDAPLMERAATCLPDGNLVFIYNPNEAVMFHPDMLTPKDTSLLSAVITSMSVNGEQLPLERLAGNLTFSYHHNHLGFQFSALNYATPSHTCYRYRLVGLEKTWQNDAETDGCLAAIAYHALPPGDYVLEVQTAINGNHWGKTTRLAFQILPPWWLTWWAKLIYCIASLLLLMGLTGLYLKRKRKAMELENDHRVNQLFELREKARHQFAESTNIDPQKIGVNDEEETLVKRMLKVIETHLDDTDFGVGQLSNEVFMSRSALYTKLRNMLGISPADFIRNVRLKRAAQLLAETNLPIGEIAERVGYNTHKAFVSNFKKLFGVLPSEYRMPKASDNKESTNS